MSAGSFGLETGAMGKAEKVAWLQFGLLLVAGACMGWLWWSSWPDTGTLLRNAALFERWPSWFMVAALGCMSLIKLLGPKEPLEDERDQRINGQARGNGFAALGLMLVVFCATLPADAWRAQVTPEWMSLALMSMLALSLLVDASCRLVCYRRG